MTTQTPTPDAGAAPLTEQSWRRVLRVSVARMLVTTAVSLVVWSMVPAVVAGWTPRVIMSGSMEPRIHTGDVIVTRTVDPAALVKGQVVTVDDPDHPGRTRTHRLLRHDAAGDLVLRGDANQSADSSHVDPRHVLGLGVLRVPFVGKPMFWLAERNWLALAGLCLVGSWCVLTLLPARRGSGHSGDDAMPGRRGGRRVAALAGATALGVVAMTAPADAAFLRATANPASTLGAATDFHPYRTAVLADSPSFLWRLDETSGTTVGDATSANRDGTLLATTYRQGQAGALASEIRSTSLGLTVGSVTANTAASIPVSKDFSVEAWVKTTSSSGGRILGMGNANGASPSSTVDRQLYLAPSGKVMFGVGSSKTAVASNAAVNNGAWHHVVATYTAGTNGMKLFVDGVLQSDTDRATAALSTGYWRAGAEQLSGWEGNPTDSYFVGNLDELAVYPVTLSATRVQAHYVAGTTP